MIAQTAELSVVQDVIGGGIVNRPGDQEHDLINSTIKKGLDTPGLLIVFRKIT